VIKFEIPGWKTEKENETHKSRVLLLQKFAFRESVSGGTQEKQMDKIFL